MQWIIALVMSLVFLSGITGMTNTPAPVVHHAPDNGSEWQQHYNRASAEFTRIYRSQNGEAEFWAGYRQDAFEEYSDEFTRIFNGLETKWSKNGRLMMRNGDAGPYKFVKRNV